MEMTGKLINQALDLFLPDIYYGNTLGLIDHYSDNHEIDFITFIDDEKFIRHINENQRIKSVFITSGIWEKIKNDKIQPIICDDPRFYYYSFYNFFASANFKKEPSVIADSAIINPKANVSEYNVVIGKNTIIEPNVTILPDVEIGDNVVIRAGAVIGSEGFEHKRTKRGILSVFHDGKVIIYNEVEVGANTCIDKGFSWRNTIIGCQTKIDNLVHIGHCAHIGQRCLIAACSQIGAVNMGDDVWVGPNANLLSSQNIGNNSFISVGSVVTRDVDDGARVTGNFAIDHKKFIQHIKNISH